MLYNNKFTVIANWKMAPSSYNEAKLLLQGVLSNLDLKKLNLIVAAPYIYLTMLLERFSANNNFHLSAQNISHAEYGAFTGQISAKMIKNLGIDFTIIGHSECRTIKPNMDLMISNTLEVALVNKLIPIICIGEDLNTFNQGSLAIKTSLMAQLDPIINVSKNYYSQAPFKLFIAYEPIWAIGSGSNLNIDYLHQQIGFIRQYLYSKFTKEQEVYLLYGGSVNLDNIQQIMTIRDLSGVLVGAAALDLNKFTGIGNYIIENT